MFKQDKSIDFICFSDNALRSDFWKIKPIPKEIQGLNPIKQQRILKICPHRYLKGYSISIWIDGSFQIVGDLMKFVRQYDLNEVPLYTRIHPCRKCIYEEAKACIKMGKDSKAVINKQIERYKKLGYPKSIGMVETGILLRRHNDIKCQMICNEWATELLLGSCRDQLSFNFVCWKNHFLPGTLKNEFKTSSETFRLYKHG